MWSAFFLYFLIFSCFPEARKAVKRTPEVKFSYTELALILLLDFIGTVRVTFHAVSAKYFVLPARNISCWKAVIGGQRVTGKLLAIFQCPFGIAIFNRSFLVWLLFGDFLRFLLCQRKGGRVPILGNFPLCLEREGIGVIIDWLGLQLLVVVARVPNTIAVEIAEQTEVVGAWGDEIEVGMSILNLEALDGFIAT